MDFSYASLSIFWANSGRSTWTILQLHSVCQSLLETFVEVLVPLRKIHSCKSKVNLEIKTFFYVQKNYKYEK